MTFIDFFAGIGGFRKGMENAGHTCVGFCEWDKFARMSYISMHLITDEQRAYLSTLDLKQRQKEILKDEYLNGEFCSTDVRLVTGDTVPRADCWCYGAPCQDFSVAGKRAGLDGDRSSLIREIYRILGELEEADRPEWLIYENVKGMLSSNQGRDYLEILMAMDELGYDAEWFVFNSKYHGVPQNRERVYTVGHLRSRGSAKVFPIKGANREDSVGGIGPECIGGFGEKNSNGGSQFYQQDRIYDGTKCATAVSGNLPGGSNKYGIPVAEGVEREIVKVGERKRENRNQASEHLVVNPVGVSPSLTSSAGGGKCPEVALPIQNQKKGL